jgi:hypothetical protein
MRGEGPGQILSLPFLADGMGRRSAVRRILMDRGTPNSQELPTILISFSMPLIRSTMRG